MNRQQPLLCSALSYPRLTSAASSSCCPDAERALLLLEEYRAKLNHTEDRQLRHSIQRVIDIFQSNLFQALIGTIAQGHRTTHTGFGRSLVKGLSLFSALSTFVASAWISVVWKLVSLPCSCWFTDHFESYQNCVTILQMQTTFPAVASAY